MECVPTILRSAFSNAMGIPVNCDKYLMISVLTLGTIALLRISYSLLHSIWVMFLRPGKNLKSYGEWAVVTGSTDGIGYAQAKALAKRGLNVYLLSRSKDKLLACQEEMSKAFPKVEIRILEADFSSQDNAMYERIERALAPLAIGVLINNVGVSYSFPDYLSALDNEFVDKMIQLNCVAATRMTRIVVNGMVERRSGAIVNIGSVAGKMRVGSPLLTLYSATKAYLDAFSRSLDAELRGKGVHVQCQVPAFVTSKLSKIRRSSITVPHPPAFAEASMRAIGYESSILPYWSHAIQQSLLDSWLPSWVVIRLLNSMHLSLRKRALKKLQQKRD